MSVVINTAAGEVETVSPSKTFLVDVSAGTVTVCIGSYTAPSGAWQAPDTAASFTNGGKTVTFGLTIGNGHLNPVVGKYYVWVKVVLSGQTLIEKIAGTSYEVTDATGTAVGSQGPFVTSVNNTAPDQSGNVTISGGAGGVSTWIYGGGSDGPLTLHNGDTLNPGFYTDITIDAGAIVRIAPAGNRTPIVHCTGTWTINGAIDLRGTDATGRTNTEASQTAFSSTGQGFRIPSILNAPFLGGDGGGGASGPVVTSGGVAVVDTAVIDLLLFSAWTPAGLAYSLNTYGIGGTGSGDGTNYGGAGGVAGTFFLLAARHLVHGPASSYLIQGGKGGDGGDDGTGSTGHGNCGGGGGGAAGWWMTISDDIVGSTSTIGGGGLGGAGCGTGQNGQPGMTARGIHYLNT